MDIFQIMEIGKTAVFMNGKIEVHILLRQVGQNQTWHPGERDFSVTYREAHVTYNY